MSIPVEALRMAVQVAAAGEPASDTIHRAKAFAEFMDPDGLIRDLYTKARRTVDASNIYASKAFAEPE